MPINLDKIKEKLSKLEDPRGYWGNNRTERKLWSPDANKVNKIRILPNPFADSDDPYVEVWTHYGVGRGGIPCARMNTGGKCQVCDFAFELRKSENAKDAETAKNIFAKPRWYAVVLDREREDLKLKYWGFSKTVYKFLLTTFSDEDLGGYLNLDDGFDAEITCSKKGNFVIPEVKFRIKQTPAYSNRKDLEAALQELEPLEQIIKPLTEAEISERLSNWLNLTENDGSETIKGSSAASDTTESTDGAKAEDNQASNKQLEDMFADL